MDVGAVLEGAVEAGDQGHLVFERGERFDRGRQFERVEAGGEIFLTRDLFLVAGEFRDGGAGLAGEEAAADDADGHVEKSEALRGGGFRRCGGETLEPGQGERGAAGGAEEGTSGGGFGHLEAVRCWAGSDLCRKGRLRATARIIERIR